MKEFTSHYPCFPEGGLDISDAIQQLQLGRCEIIIPGESKKDLRIRAKLHTDSPFLSIEDALDRAYHLYAQAYPRSKGYEAWFDIRTKLADANHPNLPQDKHPDLFAKAFIETALALFEYVGHPVTQCKCTWSDWSDNYAQFEESYKKTKNPQHAAFATWSGKTFVQLGYTKVSFLELPEDYLAFTRPTIRLLFHK